MHFISFRFYGVIHKIYFNIAIRYLIIGFTTIRNCLRIWVLVGDVKVWRGSYPNSMFLLSSVKSQSQWWFRILSKPYNHFTLCTIFWFQSWHASMKSKRPFFQNFTRFVEYKVSFFIFSYPLRDSQSSFLERGKITCFLFKEIFHFNPKINFLLKSFFSFFLYPDLSNRKFYVPITLQCIWK